MFVPEKRIVEKFVREKIRVDEEHIKDISRWITKRDKEILKILSEHPFLTTSQIEMMIFSELKPSSWRNKCNERLRRLYKAHCIDRWYPPMGKDAGSSESHYVLDICGAKILGIDGHKKRTYIPQTYRHTLKIFDFKAMLHVLNKQVGAGEIIRWKTEHGAKIKYRGEGGREKEVIPDAFCIYKYTETGRVKVFFLECDNATMDLEEQLKPKIKRYHEMFQSGAWQQEEWAIALRTFPAVLIAMHTEEEVKALHKFICSLRSNITFLLTTYDKMISCEGKVYESAQGKKREVLQSVRVNILDPIWKSNKDTNLVAL